MPVQAHLDLQGPRKARSSSVPYFKVDRIPKGRQILLIQKNVQENML